MRYTTWLMISLCVGVVPSTFAAEPAQTPSPPAQASPAAPSEAPTSVTAATADATTPVAATPPATATPPTASKTEAVKPPDLVAQAKRLRTAGYKPKVQKNGDTVWCRSEASLGSRFQSERCSSADDLDRAALYGKELTETMQKNVTQRQSN
jgi:hypothetical protein